jgi:glycosyltransferase involved in cell wall biosynthesis
MDAANRKVSVVIPTYNTNTFLSAAIESVLAQTYGVEEIIVIDDGSTDDPAAVLSGIADARLRVVRTENRGIAKARNLGCELATGDLVGFLDADDIWYPHKVERQLDVFAREPGTLVVGTQMHHIGRRDMAIGVTGVDEIDDAAQESVRTAYLMPFAISSALVDRDAYRAVGGFDPEIKDLGGVEDLDFISRVAALGPIRTVGEPLGAYRVHAGSTTARRFRAQRLGARFLNARALARDAGGDLTLSEFRAARTHRTKEWFDATARALYRASGALAADGHYFGATWRFGASVVLRPGYAIRRMRQQRVMDYLRARRQGSETANTS